MNAARRKAINALLSQVEDLTAQVEALRDEEQEYFDNMPESFQGGEKGETSQAAIDNLENAFNALEGVRDDLEEAAQ